MYFLAFFVKLYPNTSIGLKLQVLILFIWYSLKDISAFSQGDTTRSVKHFHFLQWKDFSANVQNDVMIDFIKNVRNHIRPPDMNGPVVVHCRFEILAPFSQDILRLYLYSTDLRLLLNIKLSYWIDCGMVIFISWIPLNFQFNGMN